MTPNESVVHLTMRHGETVLAVGSGVFYQHEDSFYIVTAWHNITGRHADTLEFLNDYASAPNNVLATYRVWSEELKLLFPHSVEIPLEDQDSTFYLVHPEGYPRRDVAVIPIDIYKPSKMHGRLSNGEDHSYNLPMSYPISENGRTQVVPIQRFFPNNPQVREDYLSWLGQADELFIPGYPKGITDYTGQPLWKRASVASSVLRGWESQPKFLVDCASRQGMSGAPVMMYNKSGVIQFGTGRYVQEGPVAIFAGVYSGRLGNSDNLEAQIGVVWNWTVINDVIAHGINGDHSNFLLATNEEIRAAISRVWPSTEGWNECVLDESKNHRDRLVGTIMKDLHGRVSIKELKEAILCFARDGLEL